MAPLYTDKVRSVELAYLYFNDSMKEGYPLKVMSNVTINRNSNSRALIENIKLARVDLITVLFVFRKATLPVEIHLTFQSGENRKRFQEGKLFLSDLNTKAHQHCPSKDPNFDHNNIFECDEVVFQFGFNEDINIEMTVYIISEWRSSKSFFPSQSL